MDILRNIEANKLLIDNNRTILQIGLTEFFLQMIVDVKGNGLTSDSQHFISTRCDIFYVLRPYFKLNHANTASIEPLNYSQDEAANFGFITEI